MDAQDVIDALTDQRNSVMNAVVAAVAEKAALQRRVSELEAALAEKEARLAVVEKKPA